MWSHFFLRKWHNVTMSQCKNGIISRIRLPFFLIGILLIILHLPCVFLHKVKDIKSFYKIILFAILIMSLDFYRIIIPTDQHSSVQRHPNFYRNTLQVFKNWSVGNLPEKQRFQIYCKRKKLSRHCQYVSHIRGF